MQTTRPEIVVRNISELDALTKLDVDRMLIMKEDPDDVWIESGRENDFRSSYLNRSSSWYRLVAIWYNCLVMGFGAYRILCSNKHVTIKDLVVLTSQADEEYATILMDTILRIAATEKKVRVAAFVRESKSRAQIFLNKKYRFERINTLPGYYKDPREDCYVMQRDL